MSSTPEAPLPPAAPHPPSETPRTPHATPAPKPAAPKRRAAHGQPTRLKRVLRSVAIAVLKAAFAMFVILTPLLGAWTASSLAAYANGPVWLVALTGLLLFPILPGAWEALSELIRRRRKNTKARVLTRGDRLLLRTLAVNLAFLGVLWFSGPRAAFRALSARGDWMLDGMTGPTADSLRRFLFGVADNLEFAYEATRSDPYAEDKSDKGGKVGDQPAPSPRDQSLQNDDPTRAPAPPQPPHPSEPSAKAETPRPAPAPSDKPRPAFETPIDASHTWPLEARVHPLIAAPESAAPASIEALAALVREREPDPFLRFKALHDWVASHVSYDVVALQTRKFPPQDAEAVFRARTAVCAGYSKLLKALGEAAGYRVTYVSGVARGEGGEVDGLGHAWNAVEVAGRTYLVDATWDAGSVGPSSDDPSDHFQAGYRTDYLFTPPEVFVRAHFPNEPRWQLVEHPIDRGEFMRLPQLDPAFFAAGLKLVAPDRSQVTVENALDVLVDRTAGGVFLLATTTSGQTQQRCETRDGAERVILHCALPGAGDYRLQLYASPVRYGTYHSVGEIQVLSR